MRFKEWLLLEDENASQFFYRLTLYPSDGFDGSEAFNDPGEVWSMQARWDVEEKMGRKFHNIDKKDYGNKKFFSIKSLNSPNNKPWKHKSSETPNIEVVPTNLVYLGYGKNSQKPREMKKYSGQDLAIELDRIFGDSVKEPKGLDKKFDKPFKKVYENLLGYVDLGTTRNLNTNMGIRSKYVGPDETGEKGKETFPIANFGFKRKRKKQTYISNNLGRQHEPQEPDYHIQSQSST